MGTSVCTHALADAGFDVLEARDCQHDGHLEDGEAWYIPLTPSWCPWKWPRFQFNPVMMQGMPLILKAFETLGLVPKGTAKTQVIFSKARLDLWLEGSVRFSHRCGSWLGRNLCSRTHIS